MELESKFVFRDEFAYSNSGNGQFDRFYFVTSDKQDKGYFKIYFVSI